MLLVVKDPFLRDMLRFILDAYFKAEVLPALDDSAAVALLADKSSGHNLVIHDYDPFSSFIDEVKALSKSRPGLKTVVLCQAEHEQNVRLFEAETGIKLIRKDDVPLGLIRTICGFFPAPALLNDSDYCRIAINLLVRFEGIKKNLFIRIGTDKMIQIFKEEDKTDLNDIMKYHQRGIEFLYLKRSTAEAVVTQIQRQIKVFLKANNFKFILRSPTDSPESLYEQRIIRINEDIYIDDEFQKLVVDSIEMMKAKILKEKRVDLFLSHLMNMPNLFVFFSKKIELTSMFTLLICQKLKWYSKATGEKIAYAAVLSDITLATRPKLLQIRDLEEFRACQMDLDDEDRNFFLNHPQECAALANKFFQTAPADTGVIILQHHELPDGSGFPGGLKADKISPLSAAFIIANDFAHYILTNEHPSIDDYLAEAKGRWDYTNFRQPFQALQQLREEKLKYLSKA